MISNIDALADLLMGRVPSNNGYPSPEISPDRRSSSGASVASSSTSDDGVEMTIKPRKASVKSNKPRQQADSDTISDVTIMKGQKDTGSESDITVFKVSGMKSVDGPIYDRDMVDDPLCDDESAVITG